MESDRQYHHQHDHSQRQANSGLARYQSAPSSYFSSFMDRDFSEFFNRPASPETERIFQRFLQSTNQTASNNAATGQNFGTQPTNLIDETEVKSEATKDKIVSQESDYASPSFYQSRTQQPIGNQNSGSGCRVPSSDGGSNTSLIRHSSSPAGLFNAINIENGYAVMDGMRRFEQSSNTEASFASGSRPLPPSSSSSSRLHPASWDNAAAMADNWLKAEDRTLSGDLDLPNATINDSTNWPPPLLAHHLSLPKSLSERSTAEKLLQFSDSVPCKVRAKRGCATHPRSIAERVRRTRISEKLKKLQDLVPNMDKQTNTSDMLDMAVDYIRELQDQLKTLSDSRVNCTCSRTYQ